MNKNDKMVIEFDASKVAKDGYTVNDLMKTTDEMMEKYKIRKEDTGVYIGDDEFNFMVVIGVFFGLDWFKKYVSKWELYEYYEYNDTPEDLIEKMKQCDIV